jgi:hypothetical protein
MPGHLNLQPFWCRSPSISVSAPRKDGSSLAKEILKRGDGEQVRHGARN